jgi:hypothetical protein
MLDVSNDRNERKKKTDKPRNQRQNIENSQLTSATISRY